MKRKIITNPGGGAATICGDLVEAYEAEIDEHDQSDCQHAKTELRVRITASGGPMCKLQCWDCGASIGTAVSKQPGLPKWDMGQHVGTAEAREERWGVSTDRNSTFAPSWAGNLLKELLGVDRLVLQTIPYGQNPNTAIFDVLGLREVLGELAETCNWTF